MDTALDRPRWRFTANYRIHHLLQLGLEFNPKSEEIGPLFTLFLLTETDIRPALFIGTSSDRIGSPSGEQSYFATVSKHLPDLRASIYGSLNYSEWDEALNFPVGIGLEIGKGFSIRPMYDGDRGHLLFNYFANQYGLSLILVWFDTMGVSLSAGF
ncbi:MAG: hypothetical protein VX910_10385 [Candidatus Latescibacterota bacterium]|nr:hypothetical protein [Candidatus Latescibacterota bacterium]